MAEPSREEIVRRIARFIEDLETSHRYRDHSPRAIIRRLKYLTSELRDAPRPPFSWEGKGRDEHVGKTVEIHWMNAEPSKHRILRFSDDQTVGIIRVQDDSHSTRYRPVPLSICDPDSLE